GRARDPLRLRGDPRARRLRRADRTPRESPPRGGGTPTGRPGAERTRSPGPPDHRRHRAPRNGGKDSTMREVDGSLWAGVAVLALGGSAAAAGPGDDQGAEPPAAENSEPEKPKDRPVVT